MKTKISAQAIWIVPTYPLQQQYWILTEVRMTIGLKWLWCLNSSVHLKMFRCSVHVLWIPDRMQRSANRAFLPTYCKMYSGFLNPTYVYLNYHIPICQVSYSHPESMMSLSTQLDVDCTKCMSISDNNLQIILSTPTVLQTVQMNNVLSACWCRTSQPDVM